MKQNIGQYMGFDCECIHGVSYNCPRLSIYGERDELALQRSIRRKLKKLNGKIQPEYSLGYMQNRGAA